METNIYKKIHLGNKLKAVINEKNIGAYKLGKMIGKGYKLQNSVFE